MDAAIIADDLTGAADTGVQFTRAGYRTAVAFLGLSVPPERDLDAMAVDTDSRSMMAAFAAKRVLEAGRAVRDARIVYKKIDSSLRGPVAAELAAALRATGRDRAIVAPAFPSAIRTTREGVQLVDGVPVHETEVRDDPYTPVREGHIPTLLAESIPSVSTLNAEEIEDDELVRRRLEDARCIVADAASDGDLEALVRAVPEPSKVLWVGSAGLARALGAVYPGPHAGESPPPPVPARRVLVVVGSLSGVARGQLRRLVEERGGAAPVAGRSSVVEEAVGTARAALSGGACAVVHSEDEKDTSGSVVEALAEAVADLSGLFDALVLTGGDTAVGVARRLGAVGIRLDGEVEPGIPVGTLVGPNPYRVVTKAGGFGEPDTLVKVVETLARGGKD
jgi:D-threonate/D-erythronate kinase